MLNTFSMMGEEVKIINTLPMKLVIFDEKITMLALNNPVSMKPSITTMVVNHSSFAISLKNVFESYWADSIFITGYKKMKIAY